MIRWTKDGKVARDGWPKPQFPGDMTCMAEDLADALDVAVVALRFYAAHHHLYGSLADDWDECGDAEYAGWLWPCEPAEELSWGIENGSTAKKALRQIGVEHD